MKFWLLTLALAPLGVLQAQNVAPTPSPSQPMPPAAENQENFAPLDYFQDNCERCHGPNGSFYGVNFGKNLKDDAALRQIVKDMCEGPGNAPLDDPQLEILTDFHRALRDNKPFLIIVSREKTEKGFVLSGEALPGSKITFENEETLPVTLEDHKWRVELPANSDISKARLRAVKDGQETVVNLASS